MSLYKKILLGIIVFVIFVFICGCGFFAYTMLFSKLEGTYCNEGCVVVEGKNIKYYPSYSAKTIKNAGPDDYAECKDYDHSVSCELKLHELTGKYAVVEYLGDSFVFYKGPYKPKKTNIINGFKPSKKMLKNKSHTREIYIYDLKHVVMADEGSQFWGSLKPVSVGYDRFYDLELEVYDNEQGSRVDSIPRLVYDKKNKTIMGFDYITKGAERYLNLDDFDKKGNHLDEERIKEYYGKYVQKSGKSNSTIEITKDEMTLSFGENKHTFPYYVDHANTNSVILKEDGMNEDRTYHYNKENKEILIVDKGEFDIFALDDLTYVKVD